MLLMISGREEDKIRRKRIAPALALYAGQSVAPYIFAGLLATFGALALHQARVTEEEIWYSSKISKIIQCVIGLYTEIYVFFQ